MNTGASAPSRSNRATTHGPQSQNRYRRRGDRQARAVFQDWQGIARAAQHQVTMTFKRVVNWIVGFRGHRGHCLCGGQPGMDQGLLRSLLARCALCSISMPLWALFFCGIFVGIVAGWIAAWLAQGKHRKSAREARIELARAQQEHERFKPRYRSRRSYLPGCGTLKILTATNVARFAPYRRNCRSAAPGL